MTFPRPLISAFLATALAAGGAATPAHSAEAIYDRLGAWTIVALTTDGGFGYCSAEIDNGRARLKIATDGRMWQVGVPYAGGKRRIDGYYGFGVAGEVGPFNSAGDGVAVMRISLEQVNAFGAQPAFSVNLGGGEQTWALRGAGPAIRKAAECARNGGQPQQRAAQPQQTQAQAQPSQAQPSQAQPSPAQQPQPQRAGPRIVSFYTQTSETMCIAAAGRLQEGTPIVVGDCKGAGAAFSPDPSGERIRFAANPQFCIGFDYNGAAQVLQCAGVEQSYRYDGRSESIRFAGAPPDCFGVRGALQPGARVIIERCGPTAVDQRYSMMEPVIGSAAAQAGAPPSAAAPPASGLSAARFGAIGNADLDKLKNASGCSFALYRGKDLLGLFDTQDAKKSALFKIDGKLVFASGKPGAGAYWSGTVAGNDIRLIKGPRNPNFRNDGGSQGGEGRIEWSGPAGAGGLAARWEEGC